MIDLEYETRYQNLPDQQRNLFLGFKRDHPYKTITYQNQKGKYVSSGSGDRVLVFLAGALVEPDMWFYPILESAQNYRIIAPYFPPDQMSADEVTGFIQAIFREEKITKATFIGMSYGGGVAQYLGEKHPEMVEKLILTHTGILGRAESTDRIKKLRKLIRFAPLFLIKMLLKKRVEYFPDSDWNQFHKTYFYGINTRISKRAFLDYLDSMIRFTNQARDINADRRNWKGDTAIFGSRDDKDAYKHFEILINLYPNAEHHIFEEQGGHHMIFLFPEVFTMVLSQFLNNASRK